MNMLPVKSGPATNDVMELQSNLEDPSPAPDISANLASISPAFLMLWETLMDPRAKTAEAKAIQAVVKTPTWNFSMESSL
jgi:hypothetical protein